MLQFSKSPTRAGAPGSQIKPASDFSDELKRYEVDIKSLKEDLERKDVQIADFKKIASDAEKRMNESIEEFTKIKLCKDKEIEEAQQTVVERDQTISDQSSEIERLKKESGTEDIQNLRTEVLFRFKYSIRTVFKLDRLSQLNDLELERKLEREGR